MNSNARSTAAARTGRHRRAKGCLAATFALALVASVVQAAGIDLSWDDCGTSGSSVKTFACNSNSGTSFDLVASFQPPAGVTKLLGVSAEFRVGGNPLPDWWKFGLGECRGQSAMAAQFDGFGGACTDVWQGNAVGGFAYTIGGFGTNTARLLVQGAIPIDLATPVSSATEYYATRVRVQPTQSTGAGACAGCNTPVSIRLLDVQLFQDPALGNDPLITAPLHSNQVYWQSTIGADPVITSLSPAAGAPGATITISGSGFTGATYVAFNTIGASFSVISDTEIHATVPQAARSGAVRVTTPFGFTNSPASFIAAPVLHDFLPRQASSGAPVSILGFNLASATGVSFNGAPASFSITNDSLLVATVPAAATTGPLSVTNPGGTTATDSLFRVGTTTGAVDLAWDDCGTAGASLKEFSCTTNSGPPFMLIGSMVPPPGVTQMVGIIATVQVTGPAGALPDWWALGTGGCRGGGTALTANWSFAGSTGCSDPWAGLGTGSVAYTVGTYGPGTARMQFTGSVASPRALDPTTEYYAFKALISRTKSYLDGSCSGCDLPVDLQLHQIQILQSAAANYDPVLFIPYHSNQAGWNNAPIDPNYPPPQIASFAPGAGGAGAVVTITGNYFKHTTGVSFGGVGATSFVFHSETQLTAIVPTLAVSGPITVTTLTGTATSAASFLVPPTITSFTPVNGLPGTVITINGVNFTGATAVEFTGAPASSFTVDSDVQIRATVPPGVITGPIHVTTPSGTAISPGLFGPLPVISSFTPTQGPIGTLVTVHGRFFTGLTGVKFGGVSAPVFTATNDSVAAAIVPANAVSGPIQMTTGVGTTTSAQSFLVAPTITSFTPPGGPVGSVVTISGLNFTGATDVKIAGVAAAFTVTNSTTIQATVPATVSGTIQVTTPVGNATSALAFFLPPVVDSFVPTHGPVGSSVAISGHNFFGASSITFNGVPAGFSVPSDILISATVPTGTTSGPIVVTNPGGLGSNGVTFVVDAGSPPVGGKINLAWDNCAGGTSPFPAIVKTFACNTNTGARFTMFGSFIPPQQVDEFLGASVDMSIVTPTASLPDWWAHGAGFCRGTTALATNFDFTAGPFDCVDFSAGQAAGGYAYDVGYLAPNHARLRIQYAVPFDDRGPVDPMTEYYSFKVAISRTNTTGTGSCAGCSTPACITLNSIQLFQPPESNFDPTITDALQTRTIYWQQQVTSCDVATAVLATVLVSEVASDHVQILWHTDQFRSATLYRRAGQDEWVSLGERFVDGTHQITFEDRDVTPGVTYGYRLGVSGAGGEKFVGETSVTVPAPSQLAIAGWRWSAGQALELTVSLPRAAAVSADVFDVTGRRRVSERLDAATAGRHTLELSGATALPSGVYFVRVAQGKDRITSRVVRVL